MATVGKIDARAARLQEQIRKAKEALSAQNKRKRRVLKDQEKRLIWVCGRVLLSWTKDARIRERLARELRKPGVIHDNEMDREIFGELLAGTYVSTAEDDEARRELRMEPETGGQDGAEAVPLAAE